jgi:hypothetical protein
MVRVRLTALLITTVLGWGLILPSAAPAGAVAVQLPDLRMARLSTIYADTSTIPKHRLLRYTAKMVNVGAGPFEVQGRRPDTSTPHMITLQRLYNDAKTSVEVPISGTYMFWAADGHNHWHVNDLESGTLTPLDNGAEGGALAKHGFHFGDYHAFALGLPNAPRSAVYQPCGGNSCAPSALTVDMGLSVGWSDTYPASTAYQYIDITGLKPGNYLLTVTADASHWFQETNSSNNSTWAKLRITNSRITVVRYGPGA